MFSLTSKTGTICQWLWLPWPWPISTVTKVTEQSLDGSTLVVKCNVDGTFSASLLSSSDFKPLMYVQSCPVELSEPAFVMLGISWSQPDDFRIQMNDAQIASLKFSADTCSVYHPPANRDRSTIERQNFSKENAAARLKRRGKFTGYRSNPRSIPGTSESLSAAISEQVVEAEGLLKFVDQGEAHFVPSLVNSVAKLITDKHPVGTLQLYAASTDQSLILYTSPYPNINIPIQPDFMLNFDFSADPVGMCDNPIDLDVWLRLNGSKVRERNFSNLETIKQIRNVLGSHWTYDLDPLLAYLKSTNSVTFGGNESDLLSQYITQVSRMIVSLFRRIHIKKDDY